MKTRLVNEKTHTHTYMHTARGLSCKWKATMRCSFCCCCCFSPCCYLRAWVFDPSENVCCFVPHSCLIFVSSFLAASLCRLVFACLFNYHRMDIKRSFISLARLWPELSSQSKQRKCGLKNGLAFACRCRNEAPTFSLLISLRPSRRVLKSKLLMDCCALCPTAALQTIIMASLSALMETEKVLPQLRLPSSLIINLESFWHRRERVELPSPPHTKLQRVLQSKLCFNTPIK